jgi:hypothetical protein
VKFPAHFPLLRANQRWLTARHRDPDKARSVAAGPLKFEAYLRSMEFKSTG